MASLESSTEALGAYYDDDEDAVMTPPQPSLADADEFLVIDESALDKRVRDLDDRVASLLSIPPAAAELLLLSFDWDYERLQNRYWEDPERMLQKAGVVLDARPPARPGVCSVCFEEAPAARVLSLGCGHGPFCVDCWAAHIHEHASQKGCRVLMTEDDVRRLARPSDYARMRQRVTRSLVELSRRTRWCSNPRSCGRAIEYRGSGSPSGPASCACGWRFCFLCSREWHSPVPCAVLQMWNDKSLDPDAQLSMDWVTANTKRCPKCGERIEKNQGCNHMICKCRHEFCWLCRGDWSTHGSHTGGYYSCNRYEKSDAKKEDERIANTKSELDRYMHYYNRFFNYTRDLGNLEQRRKDAAAKTEAFALETSASRFGMSSAFIGEGVELESKCRDVLRWTYVLAFFLPEGSPQKAFFEFKQANLEGITERLADLNKTPLEDLDDDQLKTRLRVTRSYLEAMEEAMAEEAKSMVESGKLVTSSAPSKSD
eukprot:m51a1_g7320 hypothetical protein (485) ;mRNA; r:146763-148621